MDSLHRTMQTVHEKGAYQLSEKRFWYWLLPLIIFVALFYLFPVIEVVRMSFTNTLLFGTKYSYTLDSYELVSSEREFLSILKNTFLFTFFSVFFQMLLGLLIAMIVIRGEKRKLKGARVVRTIVLSAWVIPGVIIGITWRMLLSSGGTGIINYLLNLLGFNSLPFLSEPNFAFFSIIVANVWRGTAFSMILQYAGFKSIQPHLYEAAAIDGAQPIQIFRFITIPQLRPILLINLTLATIFTTNVFDMIYSMTGGGPARSTEVLALSVYRNVFLSGNLGRGSALAVVLLAINLFAAFFYFRFMGKA